jgi:hypothetical protein
MGDLVAKVLDLLSRLSRKNEDKHIYVMVVGLASAVILAVFLIGRANVNAFFQQFSTNIMASSIPAIALFIANSVLAVAFIIGALLELNESKEQFERYIPNPTKGAWLLNILVCSLITLQLYTSITNILQYCVLYIVFTFVDIYFRYALSMSIKSSIHRALRDISLKRFSSETLDLETEKQYSTLLEWFVSYVRYPVLCIMGIRLLLAFSALVLIVVSRYKHNPEYNNYAYLNLIYCIIINEIFSWGYRMRLIITSRFNRR